MTKQLFIQHCGTGGLIPEDFGKEIAPGIFIAGWNPKAKRMPVILANSEGKEIAKADVLNVLARLGRDIPERIAEIYYGLQDDWSFLEKALKVKVTRWAHKS